MLDFGSIDAYCDVASNRFIEDIYPFNRQCDENSWIYKILPFLKRHFEFTADDCSYGVKLNACEKGYCEPSGYDDDAYEEDDDDVPPPSPTSHQLSSLDAHAQAI